jgi:hypothetical protein
MAISALQEVQYYSRVEWPRNTPPQLRNANALDHLAISVPLPPLWYLLRGHTRELSARDAHGCESILPILVMQTSIFVPVNTTGQAGQEQYQPPFMTIERRETRNTTRNPQSLPTNAFNTSTDISPKRC